MVNHDKNATAFAVSNLLFAVENVREPVSRVLSPKTGDDHSSTANLAEDLKQPTRTAMARRTILLLFGFAPDGVYLAASVARRPVRSYRTLSAFPVVCHANNWVVFSLWHCPSIHIGRALPGILYALEPGLSSKLRNIPKPRDRPAP